jgi:catechol 2,3-dioxygenase-like lactoylglutathione lyase family enzyme
MDLPDAPIAYEGFYAAHFFTVRDQEKSKEFYVRILGGKLIKPENPCYIRLANTWLILNSGGGPTSRQAGGHSRNATGSEQNEQLSQPARR